MKLYSLLRNSLDTNSMFIGKKLFIFCEDTHFLAVIGKKA